MSSTLGCDVAAPAAPASTSAANTAYSERITTSGYARPGVVPRFELGEDGGEKRLAFDLVPELDAERGRRLARIRRQLVGRLIHVNADAEHDPPLARLREDSG